MNKKEMQKFFEADYSDIKTLLSEVFTPIFGAGQELYGDLTKDPSEPDIALKAKAVKIDSIKPVMKYEISGNKLTVYDVTMADSAVLARSRVGIQGVIRTYTEQFDCALIVFHYGKKVAKGKEWRLSYVEKRTSAKDSTCAHRYTYLCGKGNSCRTLSERFFELFETKRDKGELTSGELTNAFDVVALSDEFFDYYKAFYEDLVQYITGERFVESKNKDKDKDKDKDKKSTYKAIKVHEPNAAIFEQFLSQSQGDEELAKKSVRDYVKKLLGRIVFLCFLQKKGYLDGRADYLAQLFNKAGSAQENFLEKVLEPLFFNILNTRKDRRDKRLLRYGNIPYLNGGLFEADDSDKLTITLPAYFWSNEAHFDDARVFKGEVTEYPYNKSWGLFDFLSRYNFTIDEGDTSDKEVGIDPEMLGKIFENLLEENKDKGTFYTPQEIVQYMARESVLAFLTNDDDEKTLERLRTFVYDKNIDIFTYKKQQELLEKLTNIKICDPAVGSGAFPMGVLNELFALRKALEDKKSDVQIKKDIVKNNIYGVDIEKGAVDIARLRFWLSIIVDEETGLEPPPLPNLDYKIMRGNSLIESYKGLDLSAIGQEDNDLLFKAEQKTLDELHSKIEENYFPHTVEEKATIRADIKRLVNEILKARGFAQDKSTVKELSNLDLHDTDEFFLWHTWFSDIFAQGGFDVIIGNPPYISAPRQTANPFLSDERQKLVNSNCYKSLYQKWDLYIPFIERAATYLCKAGGIATMIVPYPLTNQVYGKKLRELLTSEVDLFKLVDLNGHKIFENATVMNCIPFIKNCKSKTQTVRIVKADEKMHILDDFTHTYEAFVPDKKTGVWNTDRKERDANRHKGMHVLGDYCFISYGLRPNSDEKTAKGEFTKEDLISSTKDNIHCREYIEGKDIDRYIIKKIRYIEYDTKRSPAKLVRPTFKEWFAIPKIFFTRTGKLVATYSKEHFYIHNDSIVGIGLWKDLKDVNNKSIDGSIKKNSHLFLEEKAKSPGMSDYKIKKLLKKTRATMEKLSENVGLLYLLAVLNSKYLTKLIEEQRSGAIGIYPNNIRALPIPPASPTDQKALSTLAQKILDLKASDPNADTSALEAQIDAKVYKLYGLTKEEIATIEGE